VGIIVNTLAIFIGTLIGCVLHRGISARYENALFLAVGLIAFGVGIGYVVREMPNCQYLALPILSLAIGAVLGEWWNLDGRVHGFVERHMTGGSKTANGIISATLLYCVGALSIVGPVMLATTGDNTMLFTNASMDFITAMVFGSTFGWGMLITPLFLFAWQGSIYAIAKYVSAGFFTGDLITELAVVGGFLVMTTGISLLKIRDIKTLNLLPALLVPIVFFMVKDLVGLPF